jgi:hypothetical protein
MPNISSHNEVMEMTKITLQMRFSPDVHQQLEAQAHDEGIIKSELIRRILDEMADTSKILDVMTTQNRNLTKREK